ncbi:MAG: SDR family NAD(P)-dependent oxidoreductase [Alphaproteobacteria bacterium]|nr:SDR family NAD(P)-dependent oxidoreductase [Alphaproteobacteria bacterium]
MTILVTGAAGFIGYSVAFSLLERGDRVVGVDNVNNYYEVQLKEARLARLNQHDDFRFVRADVGDPSAMRDIAAEFGPFKRIVHLAAQAGVRYSLENPMAYIESNLVGHACVLELCRHTEGFEHLVYGSSSSVYGGNANVPFSTEHRVDRPISLYAATKAADELMSHAYSHLYDVPQTGLRYFTVYGPWGRPDMALFRFTDAILNDRPIRVFNYGDMRRDFTYIDDVVDGTLRALDRPLFRSNRHPPHRVFNLGNNRAESLLDVIDVLEETLGRKAEKRLEPIQPGDVPETYADISAAAREIGYAPKTTVKEGIPRFVDWFREYHGC